MKKILIIALLLLIPSSALATEAVTAPIATCPLTLPISKDWSAGPVMNVSIVSVNLRNNQVAAGVIPGIGYGISWKDTLGLDAFADWQIGQGNEPSAAGLSLMINAVKYFSAGVGMLFSKGNQPQYQLLIGGSIPLKLSQ